MATLKINDKKEFDKQVWQNETGFDNKKYNEWIKAAVKDLQDIYNCIDCGEEHHIDTSAMYRLGDVINLLSAIKVESEHEAETWTVTKGDFEDYDISRMTEEEVNAMIDDAANTIANNDGMADYFHQHIHEVAENHGLNELYDAGKHDTKIAEYVSKYSGVDAHDACKAFDRIDRMRCPLNHANEEVFNLVSNAIDDWLEYNNIATDESHCVDVESIFWMVQEWAPEEK